MIRKTVSNLRDKIKHLERCLTDYKKFNGSEYNISKILELAAAFFKE